MKLSLIVSLAAAAFALGNGFVVLVFTRWRESVGARRVSAHAEAVESGLDHRFDTLRSDLEEMRASMQRVTVEPARRSESPEEEARRNRVDLISACARGESVASAASRLGFRRADAELIVKVGRMLSPHTAPAPGTSKAFI